MENRGYSDRLRPTRNYMPCRVNNLGHLFFDLAYFPKPIKPNIIGFFLYVDIFSRRVYTTILRNGKDAENCVASFKQFIRQYKKDFNRCPRTLSCDKEPSFFAEKVRKYFIGQKIEIIYLSNSRNKSFFSESKIYEIKKL